MATAQNVIDLAGGHIRILSSPGAAVDATTSAAMLVHLQGIISIWQEKGYLEIAAPATLVTVLKESPAMLDALSTNLGVRYGNVIGKPLDMWLLAEAKDSKSWAGGRKTITKEVSFTADGMPGLSRGRYNINTDT